MGRMYTASFNGVAVDAIQDLFEVNAPSDAIVKIHSITITQSSDVGDAAAEMLRIQLSKAPTASGSGGSTPTARPLETGDAAFGGTVEANNTTQATGTVVIDEEAFNIQAGYFYRPTPEERIVLSPSERFVVELPVAPADELTMSGSITIEEIGG